MQEAEVKEQFLKAYEASADAIYRYCFFRVRNNSTVAEDVVQETFMKVWRYLCEGNEVGNMRALLYQTARNTIIDRHKRKDATNTSLDALHEQGFDAVGQDAQSIFTEIDCNQLLSEMDHLEEEEKEILVLRYVEGHGPKEIAAILGKTPNQVSVRIHRAKQILKQRYAT
ncbi:MAG: sigma-70 family RNA polymerase sigma factor [Patescibacteria group bacterium]